MKNENNNKATGTLVAGLATFGCLLTGLVALVGGLMALSQEQFVGAGACLFTAAVGFGAVAHILLSD